jgi:hypothetical protein
VMTIEEIVDMNVIQRFTNRQCGQLHKN